MKFRIANLADPKRSLEAEGLVDTGAAYPFVPGELLRLIGIEPTGSRTFVLADGSHTDLPIGRPEIAFNGESAPCLVVFGPAKTEPLFGALALESLGLEVDPVNQRFKPATLYLA